MPTLEARIPTDRPARYLRQFRTHAEAMASPRGRRLRAHAGNQHSPNTVQLRVEGTDDRTVAHFDPWGTCTLTATTNTLVIRLDAPDTTALDRLRDLITADLARFARGALTIEWNPIQFRTG
ncbi:DUF2218 domain-containing protein [Nocardia sp. ET3-3]|uniref:DUF2218 domain-containing protein n=1 Tax=Nocardia terrae TaxID=2675851 RepID=A0A7K1UTQ6_9NOCA|nr:DUF2218 domain-containing protein [Nocardia terrae]MVU77661.1 DUF2218 domain-containing protein [Nocardia terrae]